MSNDKRMIIYPFGIETTPIIRYSYMIEYHITHLVSPKGWGYSGQDASVTDGGTKIGLTIEDSFENALEDCDVILISDERIDSVTNLVMRKLETAIAKNKEILVMDGVMNEIRKHHPDWEDKVITVDNRVRMPRIECAGSLLEVPVPVITVLGDGDQSSKFHIQLSLRNYFMEEGYNVCQLGSKRYSQLFGFDAVPSFLFDNYRMQDKIVAFNHYVYQLVKKERPDILIIGIPGGIMPISDRFPIDFGEYAYIISNSIRSDIAIRTVYHNDYQRLFFEESKKFCKYRLRCEARYFNIANTKLIMEQEIYKEPSYMTLPLEQVNASISIMDGAETHIFNAHDIDSMNTTCAMIIDELSENLDVM